ncbi:MAG: hypothetical protein M3Z33_05580 [Actinomycetota bacterium]|nr:hypothetical protein [Actinomycetota bacterium]
MVDPRIYRAAFVPVVVAIVLAAFSLQGAPTGSSTSLAPDAFVGSRAFDEPSTGLRPLAATFPRRPPGSSADRKVAARMAGVFRQTGLDVTTHRFSARTAIGRTTLDTVVGVRAGASNRRVVVLAHRDALSSPATADLSGTATLAELARIFQGRSLHKTLVLVSTSGGSGGDAGAEQFAGSRGGPVEAVLVLGDLAGRRIRGPEVIPWSQARGIAPVSLRRTVASALTLETGRKVAELRLAGQFARLAFPLSVSEQGVLLARGIPAVLVGVGGERGPGADRAVSQDRLQEMGRTVLRSVSALDGREPALPAPGSALFYRRKLVPAWAVRLLVGALILPVALAALDGFARVRRRREPVAMWLGWAVCAAIPFAAATIFAFVLELTGLLPVVPSAPPPPGIHPFDPAAAAGLASIGLVLGLAWLLLRRLVLSTARVKGDPASPGAAAAVLLLAVVLVLLVWIRNPFTAALLVLPLHATLLLVAPEVHLRRWLSLAALAISLVPAALVVVYYAGALGLSLPEIPWFALQLTVGGHVGILGELAWCVAWGTLAGTVMIVAARSRRPAEAVPPRTRGPLSYAGPGSLGGTESALRR